MDGSDTDSWLDSSFLDVDNDSTTDSWLMSSDDNTENRAPLQVPSPIHKGKYYRRKNNFAGKSGGRRPLQQIFTNLVDVATGFVTQNSYAADSRRRSSVGRACGTSIPALKEHLKAEIPGLKLSNSTCARLMVAPHKRRLSSKVYKGLIQAKVPPKKNNAKATHMDSHYCSCTVKYRMEFAAQFEKEVAIFSCDCMNKVHVGGMAVSRYHQVNRIHNVNDSPNYPDHDFPQGSGYLITPCGYMRLEKVDDDPLFSHDDLGRAHLNTPRTGQIHIVNRSQKFNKMTIKEHVNDLIPIIEATCTNDNKTGIVLLVDGGPDWSDASWTVLLYLSRMSFPIMNERLKTIGHNF